MLSICIPIYNFDVRETVFILKHQAEDLDIKYEIILFDDFSNHSFRKKNSELKNAVGVIYHELESNIGRSKIRNQLADKAQYDNILFLDCDVIIHKSDFLKKYILSIIEGSKVICGGRVYPNEKPARKFRLRWEYGHKMESKTAEIRAIFPSRSFMTNNFVIKKQIFEKVKFDETLSKYGHEDTLFGYELSKILVVPNHINNPVLNGDIESFNDFISKTKNGIYNLVYLYNNHKSEHDFINNITLLNYYDKVNSKALIKYLLLTIEAPLYLLLKIGCYSPKIFNLYKLSFLVKISRN